MKEQDLSLAFSSLLNSHPDGEAATEDSSFKPSALASTLRLVASAADTYYSSEVSALVEMFESIEDLLQAAR